MTDYNQMSCSLHEEYPVPGGLTHLSHLQTLQKKEFRLWNQRKREVCLKMGWSTLFLLMEICIIF